MALEVSALQLLVSKVHPCASRMYTHPSTHPDTNKTRPVFIASPPTIQHIPGCKSSFGPASQPDRPAPVQCSRLIARAHLRGPAGIAGGGCSLRKVSSNDTVHNGSGFLESEVETKIKKIREESFFLVGQKINKINLNLFSRN